MSPPSPIWRDRRIGEAAAVVAAYAALACALLDPLFRHPTRFLYDAAARPDGWLAAPILESSLWALAWGAHALGQGGRGFFDANIFHPTPLALTTSEPLLGHLPVFGPVYGLTGNAVLAYELTLLLAISTCGAAMYALLRHWGAPRGPAFVAGFVYAYCPVRMDNVADLGLVGGQYLPLVLLFLDRTLLSARLFPALLLWLVLVLQALCASELGWIAATAVTGYVLGVLWVTRVRLPWRGAALAAAVLLLAAGTVWLFRLPERRAEEMGLIAEFAPTVWLKLTASGWWTNYLYPPLAMRARHWSLALGPSLYVGLIPLLCVGLALWPGRARMTGEPRWARAGALGVVVACYLMSLGPEAGGVGRSLPMPYGIALEWLPDIVRVGAPSRFALFLMAGVAALTGLGLARWWTWLPARRALGWALLVALLVGTAWEFDLFHRRYPVRRVRMGQLLPPVYRWLAEAPGGPVLELPTGGCDLLAPSTEASYVLGSAVHWQPLLNGYGYRAPLNRAAIVALARSLPDPRAIELLARTTGLRYLVVHLSALKPHNRIRWRAPRGLRLAGFFGSDLLFEVEDPPDADLLWGFVDLLPRRSTTLLGTPLGPLPDSARRASLRPSVPLPESVAAGWDFEAVVRVTNESAAAWPSLAPGAPHRVHLAYRWEGADGSVLAGDAATVLPYDLAPGESVEVPLCVRAPSESGPARLVVGVTQDGRWFPDTLGPLSMNVGGVFGASRPTPGAGSDRSDRSDAGDAGTPEVER